MAEIPRFARNDKLAGYLGRAVLVAFVGFTYGVLRNILTPSPAPPTVLELFSFLQAAVAGLAPLLVMTVLAVGVARRSLQQRASGGKRWVLN